MIQYLSHDSALSSYRSTSGQLYSQKKNDEREQVCTFMFIVAQLGESNWNNNKNRKALYPRILEKTLRANSVGFCCAWNWSLCECIQTQYRLLSKSFKMTRTVISSQKNKSETQNLVTNDNKCNLFNSAMIKKTWLLLSI